MLTKEQRESMRRAASADRGKAYWLDVDLSVVDVLDALDEAEKREEAIATIVAPVATHVNGLLPTVVRAVVAEITETRAILGDIEPGVSLAGAVQIWAERRFNAEFHAANETRKALADAHKLLERIHNQLADALGDRHAISGHVAGWERWILPKLERLTRALASRGA